MSLASQRPKYTRSQLSQWLKLVNQTKAPETLEELEAHIAQDPLATLKKIQLWQLAAVPFGNLGLHYSPHHTVSLDTEALFVKLIYRNLGGYCMENNAFFATILRSLGYDLFTAGARVSNSKDHGNRNPEGYGGLSHMLILVTVHGQRYVVDVGFGTSGFTQPTPLAHGKMLANVPPAEGRLVHKPIVQSMDQSQKLWVFEFRSDPESPWSPQYCFSEMEFFPEDFDVMNFYTSKSRTSWFTRMIVLTKLLLNDNHDEATGNLTLLGNELKQKLNGTSTTLVTFETEDHRIEALGKYFNVKLRPEEVRGIQGLPSEIR